MSDKQASELFILQSQKPNALQAIRGKQHANLDSLCLETTTPCSLEDFSDTATPTEGSRSSEDEWEEWKKVAEERGAVSDPSQSVTLWSDTLQFTTQELDVRTASMVWEPQSPSCSLSANWQGTPTQGSLMADCSPSLLDSTGVEPSIWGATSLFGALSLGSSKICQPPSVATEDICMFDQEHATKGFVDLDEEVGRIRGQHILSMLSDFKGVDAPNEHSRDSVMDSDKKWGTSVLPMRFFHEHEVDLDSDVHEDDLNSEQSDECRNRHINVGDPEFNFARPGNNLNRSNWNSHDSSEYYSENAFFELQEAVQVGAQRAFGAHLHEVTASWDGVLLKCSPVLKESLSIAMDWLREEVRLLLSSCFFGLRVAEDSTDALVVDFAAPQAHNELCYAFVKTGKCGRRNCTWWHEGSQQFVIRLQLGEE